MKPGPGEFQEVMAVPTRRRKPPERREISRTIEFIASELDVDGASETHAPWGEGSSYAGPGDRVVHARALIR
jgi:hypothetical protein